MGYKQRMFNIVVGGRVQAKLASLSLARQLCSSWFSDQKSVKIVDCTTRSTVARYNYGHIQ